jgi:hypothetical protein
MKKEHKEEGNKVLLSVNLVSRISMELEAGVIIFIM